MNDGPNPLMWDAQLLSCWFGRNPAVFQDFVLRHREVGRAKDLSAPLRKISNILMWLPTIKQKNTSCGLLKYMLFSVNLKIIVCIHIRTFTFIGSDLNPHKTLIN
jgi:hypothetical protein